MEYVNLPIRDVEWARNTIVEFCTHFWYLIDRSYMDITDPDTNSMSVVFKTGMWSYNFNMVYDGLVKSGNLRAQTPIKLPKIVDKTISKNPLKIDAIELSRNIFYGNPSKFLTNDIIYVRLVKQKYTGGRSLEHWADNGEVSLIYNPVNKNCVRELSDAGLIAVAKSIERWYGDYIYKRDGLENSSVPFDKRIKYNNFKTFALNL